MSISPEEVKHIALLARIDLCKKEIIRMTNQLSEVLDYFKILDEVDVVNIKPTVQLNEIFNVCDGDSIDKNRFSNRAELLDRSELTIENHQIKVKKALL